MTDELDSGAHRDDLGDHQHGDPGVARRQDEEGFTAMNWEKVAENLNSSAADMVLRTNDKSLEWELRMKLHVLGVLFHAVATAIKSGIEEDMFREVDELRPGHK